MTKQAFPYGVWPSKLSAEALAGGGHRFGHLTNDQDKVYWLESRPQEQGRVVIMSASSEQAAEVITPDGFSVRSRAHEYGGGDFEVSDDLIVFANDSDQRLYLQKGDEAPQPITPEPTVRHGYRYADMELNAAQGWLVCIRESHDGSGDPLKVVNEIVRVDLDSGEVTVLVSGSDFYAFPRLSPRKHRLCWIEWQHPNMPWDHTTLWVAQISESGDLTDIECLADNENESIYQPAWCPDGVLHFVSDRSGWWNIYSYRDEILNALTPLNAEFGYPLWQFGVNSYTFIDTYTIVAAFSQDGREQLCLIEPEKGHMTPLELPYCTFSGGLHYEQGQLFVIAASETSAPCVISWDMTHHKASALSQEKQLFLQDDDISIAQAIRFPTDNERHAHAFFYAPKHHAYTGKAGELPPLLVFIHGGPTSAATAEFNAGIQFWTNRGFAVVDVNHGGSTGFGREYRDRLKGQWGVVDVADCVNAARYLIDKGMVDGNRCAIRGGSAGGFTVYSALIHHDLFSCGMSRYGVADLSCLVKDSHKFEVRYLDSLIGRWPEDAGIYEERSPINLAEKINKPLLLLQGDEDAVVPKEQSIAMSEALKRQSVPHALIMFEGEQHGFRKSESIQKALESELAFYAEVFGLSLMDLKVKVNLS